MMHPLRFARPPQRGDSAVDDVDCIRSVCTLPRAGGVPKGGGGVNTSQPPIANRQ